MNTELELYHHGIKGQKWGVRRFQNEDGSYTQAGRERYGYGVRKRYSLEKIAPARRRAVDKIVAAYEKTKVSVALSKSPVGKKYVDTYLDLDTSIFRIQSNDTFENFAFYATYKQHDVDEYAGLFGKNLRSKANAAARQAEKEAQRTGDDTEAKRLREIADSMNIYQLQIKNTDRLNVPSEENCGRIISELVKDKQFKEDLDYALRNAQSKMKRPSQQILFKNSIASLNKNDSSSLKNSDLTSIYRALNLSLTNHDAREVRMQDKFYGALKQNGYSALLDLNDSAYSSYHAHSPVIVFDTDKVKLQSVSKMDNNRIETLYKKYNAERIRKEIPEQAIGILSKYGSMQLDKAFDSLSDYWNDYLGAKR